MTDDFKDYVVEYPFEGARWGATIRAASFDDAKRRIEAMGAWGTINGELMMTIPAVPGAGLFVRAYVWLRNLVRI